MLAKKDKSSDLVRIFSVIPDELAFVSFARYCGFSYMGKHPETGNYIIKTTEGLKEYSIDFSFPFSSER